jgi:hypothetical protein
MSQTQESTVPGYIRQPTKDALKDIQKWLGSDSNYVYGSKEGENLFTGMNSMQTGATGNIDWLADQDLNEMFGLNKASGLWDQYASAGPELAEKQGWGYDVTQGLGRAQDVNDPRFDYTVSKGINSVKDIADPNFSFNVTGGQGRADMLNEGAYGRAAPTLSTKGVMDESGPLGAIAAYMGPYLEQVLNPQIREINEASDRNRRGIGAQAAMAGAFGDARHGVMEGENYEKTNQAITDATGKTYADAFLNALTQRQQDMGRIDSMATQDAALTENAQARRLSAGQSNQAASENALARALQANVATGNFSQAGAQMGLDAAKSNQASALNTEARRLAADTSTGGFKQSGAELGLTAGKYNQDSANNALARQLQGDIQTGQFDLAGRQMDQQIELANQGARQNATERLATAGQAAQSIGNNSLSNFMNVNDALMNAGNFTQAQEEARRKTQQQFQEALATKDYNSAIRLLQALQGAPKEGTVTTESTDGLFGILGSVLGGLF